MSTIPPQGGSRQPRRASKNPNTVTAEAARRGVSEHQVRRERAARGEGAAPNRLSWERLDDIQEEALRESVSQRRWRAVIGAITVNQDIWWDTGDTPPGYKEAVLAALGWDEDKWEDMLEENPSLEYLLYYHHKRIE